MWHSSQHTELVPTVPEFEFWFSKENINIVIKGLNALLLPLPTLGNFDI